MFTFDSFASALGHKKHPFTCDKRLLTLTKKQRNRCGSRSQGWPQSPSAITQTNANEMRELIYKKESYTIVGACFEVYNEKGCGFLEPVYQECLGIEFEHQRIPAIGKPWLTLSYRDRILKQTYQADYVCFERIIVELKAVSTLVDEHRAQLWNYLHAT